MSPDVQRGLQYDKESFNVSTSAQRDPAEVDDTHVADRVISRAVYYVAVGRQSDACIISSMRFPSFDKSHVEATFRKVVSDLLSVTYRRIKPMQKNKLTLTRDGCVVYFTCFETDGLVYFTTVSEGVTQLEAFDFLQDVYSMTTKGDQPSDSSEWDRKLLSAWRRHRSRMAVVAHATHSEAC
ncbi:hypothetical protein FOL47_007678 [Perkinsus chesapeaki]|uniref:Longin domain-containing protein n=1 Tax=Perkinsus chesapeaki TaxID=330153 RepID=A0A7J6LIZ6_PERCH|nr:hypothetical protein FOL47_007678 [Perkinsus chesapeaki]